MPLHDNEVLKERRTAVCPVRIVKCGGEVRCAENLLVEKELVVTFNENRLTQLTSTDETKSYVVLDFGRELHGGIRLVTPQCTAVSPRVRLTFGESVTEALSAVETSTATNDHSPRDFDVIIPNLSVTEFGQTGFRFVKIQLLDNCTVSFKNVVAITKMPDIDRKGYIKTNDELFNKIIDTAIYTCELNAQDGVIWDGIKRDRLVWSGDLNSEILTLSYVYGNIEHIKNSLTLLRKTTPDSVWMNHIPSYSAWWVLNLVDYYRVVGDERYYAENVDYVNYVMNELDVCVGEDGVDFGKTGKPVARQFFLDWQSCDHGDEKQGVLSLIWYTCQKILDFPCDGVDFDCVKRLQRKLSQYVLQDSSLKQVVAVQGVCGKEDGVKQTLEAGGTKGFSTFMSYFLFKALAVCGSEKVIPFAKEYYGGMLERGATTFWEDFDMEWLNGSGRIDEETPSGQKDLHADYGKFCYKGLRHSLCHGWSSGIVAVAVEDILGVKILESGFKKIKITPNLFGLKQVEGCIPTPYGDLKIFVTENEVKTVIPKGITVVTD